MCPAPAHGGNTLFERIGRKRKVGSDPVHGGNTKLSPIAAGWSGSPDPVHGGNTAGEFRFRLKATSSPCARGQTRRAWCPLRVPARPVPMRRGEYATNNGYNAEDINPVPAYGGNTMPQDIGESSVDVRPCARGKRVGCPSRAPARPVPMHRGNMPVGNGQHFPLRRPTTVHRGKQALRPCA